jgi:hypothetical protein
MLELNVRSLITLYIQPQGNKKNDLSQKHKQCNQRDQLLKFLMGKKNMGTTCKFGFYQRSSMKKVIHRATNNERENKRNSQPT